jgi:hypothetical protein
MMKNQLIFCALIGVIAPLNSQAVEVTAAPRVIDECESVIPISVKVEGEQLRRYSVSKLSQLRCLPAQPRSPWTVQKLVWDSAEESLWQQFVGNIGRSKCSTVDQCLASRANILREEDISATHIADCADFPMYLRAYFSYRRQLPFTMGINLIANSLTEDQQRTVERRRLKAIEEGREAEFEERLQDLRYSMNGNVFNGRVSIPNAKGRKYDFFEITRFIHNNLSSGSYRMLYPSSDGRSVPDFYSPAIDRKSIKIGTVLYKPDGHVAIVYEVTADGDVLYVDAHPDGSVTRGRFNSDFMRSTPTHGSNFKNWRPFRASERGVTLLTDAEIVAQGLGEVDFAQYFGTHSASNGDWKDSTYQVLGQTVGFHEYVKIKLFDGVYKIDPIKLFGGEVDSLCADFQGRADAVQAAVQVGLHLQSHSDRLVSNIFGAEGDWEAYSTPGRDLRLRKRVLNLVSLAKNSVQRWLNKDPMIFYKGTNLKQSLIRLYNQKAAACKIKFKDSKGKEVIMGLPVAVERMTLHAFDPYLCPEMRWGARYQSELKTCEASMDKHEWYQFQQFLRNQTVRDPSEIMGWSLQEIQEVNQRAKGVYNPEDYNILRMLEEL